MRDHGGNDRGIAGYGEYGDPEARGGFTDHRGKIHRHSVRGRRSEGSRELHHRAGQRDWRCARTASEDAVHRIHGLKGSGAADQRTRRQDRSRTDVDQAHGAGNGRQGRDRGGRRGRYRRGGGRHGAGGVRVSRAEMFGVFARDRLRKDLRHVRTEAGGAHEKNHRRTERRSRQLHGSGHQPVGDENDSGLH